MTSHGKRGVRAREHAQRHKVRRFMRRLNPSLRTKLLEVDPRTLEDALNAASRQESRVEAYQGEKPEDGIDNATTGVTGVPVSEESVVKVDAAYEELLFVETF
ncbi:hypothetical protein Taro_005361 [Colocasia esculenta]|uniref:Uncharacterized protein n=1 Tax=Colocasia esculenta TaxID=4460 RepID=A0A843TUD4_COLES|nr:hypothetical protein [Colocasia esculenta]